MLDPSTTPRVQIVHEGQRVRVRGRIWEVREAPQVEGGQILTLSPVGDDAGSDLRVLYPVEEVEPINHQATLWHLGSHRGFRLLHDGVRLSLKVPPDRILANRLGRLQAFFRDAGADIVPLTGSIRSLEKRVAAAHERGAIAYVPPRSNLRKGLSAAADDGAEDEDA